MKRRSLARLLLDESHSLVGVRNRMPLLTTTFLAVAGAACLGREDEAPRNESERRISERWPHYARRRIALEGQLGTIVDLSESGARVECVCSAPIGEAVRLDLPSGMPVRAMVLYNDGGVIRLRFEYPIEQPL